MKLYLAASICKDFHQVSLWSPLLTLALAVGTLRQSAPGNRARSRWLLRRCWRQQLALRFSCICRSVEFLPSSRSPHGTGRGNWHLCPSCTPRRTCPEQTAARAAKGGFVPDPLSCSNSLTKDGVGSQRGLVWIRAWMSELRIGFSSVSASNKNKNVVSKFCQHLQLLLHRSFEIKRFG